MNSIIASILSKQRNLLLVKECTNLKHCFKATLSTEKSKTDEDIFSIDSNVEDDVGFDLTSNIPEVEENLEKEQAYREYVEKMRNVSRFSKITAEKKYKKLIPTYSDTEALYLNQARYFRNVYSKHGKNSGIDPGVAWPTKKELDNLIRDEIQYGLTLKQKIDKLIQQKRDEIQNIEKLEKETDDALNKMPKMIEKYYQNVNKKDLLEADKLAKRQEVLDQAREYYGFEVDLRDKRIKDMVDKLQEEKRKADKLKKKEDDRKKFQMMKQLKVSESDNTSKTQEDNATTTDKV